jgi:hypothetical protein
MINFNDIKKMIGALNIFEESLIDPVSQIIQAIKEARKLRISALANTIKGNYASNYKRIQRLLNKLSTDVLSKTLLGLYDSNENVILIDYTEIERKYTDANKPSNSWIGTLKDGEMPGVGILTASVPYKGRSIPIIAKEYSSRIINNDCSSKNLLLQEALQPALPLLKGKVMVADREFCSETILRYFERQALKFAIRFKVGRENHKATITDIHKNKVDYSIQKGQTKIWRDVYYKGKIKVNLIGVWDPKYKNPLYIITNYDPEDALRIYKLRMKLEESFRDVKDKFGITKIMTKTRANFIKLILLAFLAYGLLLLVGETLKNIAFNKKSYVKFSGIFILLNMPFEYTYSLIKAAIKSTIKFLKNINHDYFYLHKLSWGTAL